MKVLFFSAWYPHRYDAMAGLFVRKHAEAVAAQGVDVAVFYLHEAPCAAGEQLGFVEQETNGVREFYYYYTAGNRLAAYGRFWKGFLAGYEHILANWGKPDLVQVNVLAKNAWCAYYLWERFKIPYVVIEHWSGYLPANGDYKGWFHKRLTERLAREAKALLPVSPMLMEAMKAHGIENEHWELVNNVVDGFFYKESGVRSQESGLFTFLHVSCFDEAAKNTCGILRATAELYKERQDFRLLMVGTGQDVELAKETAEALIAPLLSPHEGGSLLSPIIFTGEVTPQEVADYMREADCFVLFSNYENAPVVLSECLAVGLPILTSRVGFVPQVVTEDVGRVVEPRDEKALKKEMAWMIDHAKDFDKETIRLHGRDYSYEAVGKHLISIYKQALSI